MPQIAQRYLDEIEEICNFKYAHYESESIVSTISDVIAKHWNTPNDYAGLFTYCHPIGCETRYDICHCLTQIRKGSFLRRVRGIRDHDYNIIPDLTEKLLEDNRISTHYTEILPEHLRKLTILTEEQKQQVRDTLMPYAEWQTRLRLHYQDVPVEELELQEV